ncbi:MAG: OB-fold nucleic acid binding domain-containing protein [Nanoarchaeota archaeon]
MKESSLLKIALACSLVGLGILYLISEKIEIKDYKPTRLNENIGDDVSLKGVVTKITDAGNAVFIEVNQDNPVTVVLFANNNNLKLGSGDKIEVIGEVQEYNGRNEIIAQRIRIIG